MKGVKKSLIPKVRSLIDMIFESSSELSKKANSSDVYNKTEIDEKETALNNTINQNKTDLQSNINLKANSSDVYTKTEINETLLPMTMLKGIDIRDNDTVTFQVEKNKAYLFVNTHINIREVVLITQQTSTSAVKAFHIDRILSTAPEHQTSFSFKDGKITITGTANCRGRVYKLNYQIAV